MSNASSHWISAALLALACHAPVTMAQPVAGAAERLHASAVASFRQARFAEAYGRFISLADAGHAPSAAVALWMYQQGPTLFGREWDITPEQQAAWSQLARRSSADAASGMVRVAARSR